MEEEWGGEKAQEPSTDFKMPDRGWRSLAWILICYYRYIPGKWPFLAGRNPFSQVPGKH